MPCAPAPGARRVALVWGAGGTDVSQDQIDAAQEATGEWSWTVCRDVGADVSPSSRGVDQALRGARVGVVGLATGTVPWVIAVGGRAAARAGG